MASLYKRARSRYWWVEYVDAAGERRQKSTKLRYRLASESRKAIAIRDELTLREADTREKLGGIDGDGHTELWAKWVPRFIRQRYGGSPLTLARYEAAWVNIAAFMEAHDIIIPRQLQRQQVRDYLTWRTVPHPEIGVHKATKNTALLEVKFLGLAMHEAIESGFCTTNPCSKLGVRRDQVKAKPKISSHEHRLITRALKMEPEWMRVSYKIAWEQGCRFSETCLPLRDVDLTRNVIGFRTKGEKETIAEFPLSRRLRPMLRRLIREGREYTFQMPDMPAKTWHLFFRRLELRHLCFHCTRVTFVTRCYEAGIPREHVMRLAGHVSTLAHEIYPRLPAQGRLLQDLREQLL